MVMSHPLPTFKLNHQLLEYVQKKSVYKSRLVDFIVAKIILE